jgi:hypothetical protein
LQLSRTFLVPALALGLGLIGAPAGGQAIVISSGQDGGYYDSVGSRLRTVLSTELSTVAELRASEGSLDNLSALDDPSSPVTVGFAQADALRAYLDAHPGFATQVEILGDLGRECAFLVTRKRGGIPNAAALKAGTGGALAVGQEQSGAALTYEYMSGLDNGFRNTPVVRLGMLEALLQLKVPGDLSNVGAVMFVQRPKAVPPLEVVLENQDVYRFVPITAADVPAGKLPGERPVYTFGKVQVGFGTDFSTEVETLCTRGLLLASKQKLSAEQLAVLSEALLNWGGYVIPGRR